MRAMDEKGKWLPKSRKVYDLDKNGERIRLASGRWKSHKENTVDWNNRKYAEIWRQGWADTANRYLEANDRPERLDLRSYARQGIDQIPTVHMGAAACQMEKKGIQTNIGNLNRDIKTANRLMRSCTTLTSTRQRTSNPALTAAPAKSKRKASPIPSANITGLTRRTILSAMSPGGAAGGSCPS